MWIAVISQCKNGFEFTDVFGDEQMDEFGTDAVGETELRHCQTKEKSFQENSKKMDKKTTGGPNALLQVTESFSK